MSDSVSLLAPLSPEIVIDDVEGIDRVDKRGKAVFDFTTGLFVDFARFILIQGKMIEDDELLPLIMDQGIALSDHEDLQSILSGGELSVRTTNIDHPEVIYALSLLCSSKNISTTLRDKITNHLLLLLLDLPECVLPSGLNRAVFFSAVLQNVILGDIEPLLFATYMRRQLVSVTFYLKSNYSHEMSQMACACLNLIKSSEDDKSDLALELFQIANDQSDHELAAAAGIVVPKNRYSF